MYLVRIQETDLMTVIHSKKKKNDINNISSIIGIHRL